MIDPPVQSVMIHHTRRRKLQRKMRPPLLALSADIIIFASMSERAQRDGCWLYRFTQNRAQTAIAFRFFGRILAAGRKPKR
jgi:hypothetical protein